MLYPGSAAVRYYGQVLHNSLLAGACGWMAWNNTDFALTGQAPYRHHAFTLQETFGNLARGSRLTFQVAGSAQERGFLPVHPAGATVLAVDSRGRTSPASARS